MLQLLTKSTNKLQKIFFHFGYILWCLCCWYWGYDTDDADLIFDTDDADVIFDAEDAVMISLVLILKMIQIYISWLCLQNGDDDNDDEEGEGTMIIIIIYQWWWWQLWWVWGKDDDEIGDGLTQFEIAILAQCNPSQFVFHFVFMMVMITMTIMMMMMMMMMMK